MRLDGHRLAGRFAVASSCPRVRNSGCRKGISVLTSYRTKKPCVTHSYARLCSVEIEGSNPELYYPISPK